MAYDYSFKEGLIRYSLATIGLFLVSFGIALTVKSNLGTAPLSCPAYVLSMIWPLSVGTFTFIVNTALILIQLLVLRRQFKSRYLLQIIASIILGYMIDLCMLMLSDFAPASFASRMVTVAVACIVTAMGVSLEVLSEAWMLSAEFTVYAFTKVCSTPFGTIKIIMDSVFAVLAALICLTVFGNPFGSSEFIDIAGQLLAKSPGTVIGISSILCAILPGYLMKFTDLPVSRLLDRLLKGVRSDGKWRGTMQGKQF